MTTGITALRGAFVTFRDDPFQVAASEALVYEEDGLIVIENGLIKACGR